MRDNALYFPYINVPNSGWFTRTLLYWDKVSSIVPSEYVYYPERLNPYMRELVAAELVHQIVPGEYIYNKSNFDKPFLQYIHEQIKRQSQYRRLGTNLIPSVPLHIEKIDQIADELVQLELAQPDQYPWYKVESWVANAFMAYLATTLGRLTEVNAAPVTDQNRVFRLLSDKDFQKRCVGVREIILSDTLPSPAKSVSIAELVDFKARHSDLLRRFRNKVEAKCIELTNISDSDAMKDQIKYTISEFKEEIDQITDSMRRRWTRIALTNLTVLLGEGGALATTSLSQPIAFAAGGFSLVGAIYQTFSEEKNYKEMLRQPLAYAALARSTFKQF